MFQSRRSRNCVWPCESLLVACVRHKVARIGNEPDVDFRQLIDLGHSPRLGAVCQVTIGKIKDRHHVFECQPYRFDRHVEAISGRRWRDNYRRTFAVASPDGLKKIGLLGFCWQTGGWSATLNVDNNQGQFGHNRQTDCFLLQSDSRTRGSGQSDVPGKARPDRGANGRNLVLGLKGFHPVILMTR